MNICSLFLIDNFGRRPLLLVGFESPKPINFGIDVMNLSLNPENLLLSGFYKWMLLRLIYHRIVLSTAGSKDIEVICIFFFCFLILLFLDIGCINACRAFTWGMKSLPFWQLQEYW